MKLGKKATALLQRAIDLAERLSKNCGAGAPGSQGFQPNNTCSRGGGGDGGSGNGGMLVREVPVEEFAAAYNDARKGPKGNYLSEKSTEDLQAVLDGGGSFHLDETGKVGYIITGEKDLQGVFNNGGPPGSGSAAVRQAVADGAETLDCFDGKLPGIYGKLGFVETSRIAWDDQYAPKGWDYEKDGRPDVVFMRHESSIQQPKS
jgi:hypothetical protein